MNGQRETHDVAIISPPDDIDAATMGTLIDRFLTVVATAEHLVVLDLTATAYIDPGGISAVIGLHRALEMNDRSLVVAGSPPVRRLLEPAGLLNVVGCVDTAVLRFSEPIWSLWQRGEVVPDFRPDRA